MALFGGLLGFIYMVTFPAQAFSSVAEYEKSIADLEGPVAAKPGDSYYIEGATVKTRAWEAKRQQFSTAGAKTVSLSAEEINGWMASKFRVSEPPKGERQSGILIQPGIPNVGLVDGEGLYLNLPLNISAYGSSGECGAYLFGTIEPSGFKIKSMQISSAKIPLPGIIGKRVMNTLSAGYKSTEEYQIISDAFDRVESTSIKDGQLVVVLR